MTQSFFATYLPNASASQQKPNPADLTEDVVYFLRTPKILDNIYFYPPAQHAYQCSICGRACDMSCYIHLEEKGVLTKSFKTPFRKREEWKFKIEDFEN